MTKTELIETYKVVDDAGQVHVVNVFATIIYTTMLDGSSNRSVGTKSHKLANGSHVNVNDDGTLLVVQSGRVMRRV